MSVDVDRGRLARTVSSIFDAGRRERALEADLASAGRRAAALRALIADVERESR